MKTVKTLFSALFSVLAACLLLGCLNPASFNPSSPEPEPAAEPELSDWEPFDVTLTINGDGSVSMGGDRSARAVAGFGSDDIKASGTGARNYMQLIVAQDGAVTSFSAARQEGSSGAAFQVDVTSGKTYDFLLLMGHWEKEGAGYKAGVPPTLLAAGLHTQEIQSGSNTVTISMYPIVVETEFTAGSDKVGDPGVDRVFSLIPGNWNAVWKVTRGASGTNPFDILVNAQKKISGQAAVDTLILKDKSASAVPTLGAGSLSGNVYTLGIGTYALPQVGTEGYANFKLEYIPFGILDAGKWADFPSEFYDEVPVWIIRNGINDVAQNAQTDFSIPDNWPGSANGNGAAPWKITVKTPGSGGGGGSTLEVKDGSFEGPADSETPKIGFTTDGYTGDAEGYYAVVPKSDGPPDYSDYTAFPDSYGPGTYTGQEVTLPAAGGDYDVYVIIYKDGAVSDPLIINTKEASGNVDWIWGDALYQSFYVKSTGNDTNTGAKTDPLRTVQKALEKLAAVYASDWPGYGGPDESPGGIIILDAVPVAAQIDIDGSKYPPIVLCDDSESAGGKLQAQASIEANNSLLKLTNSAKVTLAGDLILAGLKSPKIKGVAGHQITFTMDGGEISNSAGGVKLTSSIFTMNGGKISNNSNTDGGGANIYGTFIMNGGEISANSATFGSGVSANGTFIMNGGKISGNNITDATLGGGVYITGGTFTMNGGEISGNKGGSGGGVFISPTMTFTMHKGKISGNSASFGGGVYINENAVFIMDGGEISGNIALSSPSGPYAGGGVLINIGKFEKTGGTIYGYNAGDAKSNTVKNSSSGAVLSNQGHAIALREPSKAILYFKETTVGPGVQLHYKYPNIGDISGWD